MKEGPDILKKAAKHSRALASALDVWGDITFDFQSTDTLDTVETPTASREDPPENETRSFHHACDAGHLLLPAAPHGRRDPGADPVRDRRGVGRRHRVHRRHP